MRNAMGDVLSPSLTSLIKSLVLATLRTVSAKYGKVSLEAELVAEREPPEGASGSTRNNSSEPFKECLLSTYANNKSRI